MDVRGRRHVAPGPNENRAGPGVLARQMQHLHIHDGGRQLGAGRQHEDGDVDRNARQAGWHHDQRPGGWRGNDRNQEQGEHGAGRRNGQGGGGIHGPGRGGHHGQGGGGRPGPGPRVENDQRPGDFLRRRGDHHQERRYRPDIQQGRGDHHQERRDRQDIQRGRGDHHQERRDRQDFQLGRGDHHQERRDRQDIQRGRGDHHQERRDRQDFQQGRGDHHQERRNDYAQRPQRPLQDREPKREQKVRRLGFKTLEELELKDPSEVAITLASHPGLKEILSATEMRPDLVELFCSVLCKACDARLERQSIQHLLGLVKSSDYLRICIPQYIVGMATEPRPDRRHRYPEKIQNIITLLQEITSIFPSSSIQQTSMVVALIPASINILRASGVDVEDHIEQNLERISNCIQRLQDRKREGNLRVDRHIVIGQEDADDLADFRTLSVYPTHEEIHLDAKPGLRANSIKQKFETTAIYLDTHFRLLREDFVRPLREGIQEILAYRDNRDGGKPKFDDIRVYYDARIICPMCTSSGVAYKVTFDVKPLKYVRWQNSKRLLFGSLVCLSQDYFESFLFATVSNRDTKELEKGEIQLQFSEQSRELLLQARPTDSFIMVETTAYFEAYRHVLEGLKEMDVQEVPFQKYIVSCEKDVGPPRYLTPNRKYDLNCIRNPDWTGARSLNKINILDPREWPTKESLGFDDSQIEAVQLALTKELAIIQGPPGTGKTYVGLKIAQALLTNQDVWQDFLESIPVLVVCYTNHALDQFLEGIHKFLKNGIVRVGGRSSSEDLQEFNLKELRQKSNQRNCPFRRASGEIIQEMKESERKIEEGSKLLHVSTTGIIREKFLQRYISEEHWDSLKSGMEDEEEELYYTPVKRDTSMLVEWLGLGSSPFFQTANLYGAGPAGPEPDIDVDEDGAQEEELLDVQEEADIIRAERELDDDDFEEVERKRKRRANVEEDEDLASIMLAISLKHKEAQDPQEAGDGWETTKEQKKKVKHRIKSELKKVEAITEAEAQEIFDVWSLDLNSRWRLYRYWIQLYQTDIRRKIMTHEHKYQVLAERLTESRQRRDLEILQGAKVIGMTTTGAAKYRRILLEVQPRIVIVEEAAEVLEAHIITTLSPSCQHLILIGDHQQLRPSANVYELAKKFHLEVSLFERLIESELPYVRLNYQHRMRPEIARLLTPHIYSQLENHPSVLDYENIKGVSTNLFFVKHNVPEQNIKDGKSRENLHEAKFVVALCRYLLHQEYKPSQITILTTYTGQLFCLRKLMPAKEFSGVKVHVVDKYQGEENDIILLSLVRSNTEGKVGFLSISNRVCVALSRAKKGLYCIGDMEMLSRVPLWSHILGTLKQKEQVGSKLMLSCQNHPDTHTLVSKDIDFKSVPEGGCTQKCEFRLNCGHVCTRVCHPYDQEHKEYQCHKDCQKVLCADGHKCKRKCFQDCGKCMVKVEKTIPSCGHKQMVPCSVPENEFCCTEPCLKDLPCGHPCTNLCGQECTTHCLELREAELRCGHVQEVKCWQKRDIELGMPVRCRQKCRTKLSCGHKCSGSCEGCFQGRFHEGCKHPCKAVLVCSHECQTHCTRECPPCNRPCQNRCVHSQCKKKCGESCVPCMEPCEWKCQHYRCRKLCSEPCDRPPCNSPCKKQLGCGHPCIGLCGEPCPKECRYCNQDEVTEIFFGFEDEQDARFVQLEDCGHIFESNAMDTYMEGQSDSEGGVAIKLKECPKCKTPIRKNLRYGTLVNRTLSEIENVKERMAGPESERNEARIQLLGNLKQMKNVKEHFTESYQKLKKQLEDPGTSLGTLRHIETMMLFYEKLANLLVHVNKVDVKERISLMERFQQIQKWLEKSRSVHTQQELSDLQTEVTRLTYLLKLLAKCKEAQLRITPEIQTEIKTLRDVLESNKRFTDDNETFMKEKLKELDQKLPSSGLGITEKEREMILKAMNLTKGHWFKCPNGHVYCITECGGAMQRSRCPECREEIGGENHNLVSSNRLASEMDGAQHAAWSDVANNMMNFQDFQDLLD